MTLSEPRPWGGFDVLRSAPNYAVKVIRVEPGHRLSYQMHQEREEVWVVISGQGLVTIEDEEWTVEHGDQVAVARNKRHRVQCIGTEPLIMVEVQLGRPDEGDIVRFSDDYGRIITQPKR